MLAFLALPSDQAALETLEAGRFLRAGPVVPGMAVPVDEKARGRMSYVPCGPNLRELGDGIGKVEKGRKGVMGELHFEFWEKNSGWFLLDPNRFVYL